MDYVRQCKLPLRPEASTILILSLSLRSAQDCQLGMYSIFVIISVVEVMRLSRMPSSKGLRSELHYLSLPESEVASTAVLVALRRLRRVLFLLLMLLVLTVIVAVVVVVVVLMAATE